MNIYQDFVKAIRGQLRLKGLSVRAAALKAGLPIRSVQGVLEGHVPSIERAAEIAEAVGLQLRFDFAQNKTKPINTLNHPENKKRNISEVIATYGQEKNTQKILEEILCRLPEKAQRENTNIAKQPIDIGAVYWKLIEYHQLLQEAFPHGVEKNKVAETASIYNSKSTSEAHHISVFEVDAAAGIGALNETEQVVSYVAFRPDWLKKHGLDPNKCAIIRVKGESMEPTLLDQSAVLVDRNRQRRYAGRIYVIRTDDVLLVKRLDKDKKGNWLLVSDNPEWEDAPLPNDAKIIGEVKWSGKTFT